jgi:GntR family transcriptional regulator
LSVDFASPVPVYEQIKKVIKYAIAKKALVEEEPLPSIRELAAFLKINPNTVARAYRELSQEGVTGGRAGKGFWVAKIEDAGEKKIELLKEEFLKFLEKAIAMGFAPDIIKNLIDDFFREGQ